MRARSVREVQAASEGQRLKPLRNRRETASNRRKLPQTATNGVGPSLLALGRRSRGGFCEAERSLPSTSLSIR
eukprot:10706260-Alexandrium_andersonii.AAC.1